MTDTDNDKTTNTVQGNPAALVQTRAVHGDVHIVSGLTQPPASIPRQLPLPATGFVDRTAHLRQLDALAREAGTGVPVAVLAGPPGVGKTALAVHWAHQARDRFPDGDLYANVHGHVPGPRAEAAQVLDAILRALGVPPDRIPLDVYGRSALYRSEINDKRLLVVIDDVLDAAQVRPLLPASPGCMVVVTSRSTLPGLVAREGAQRFPLDVLPIEDSVSLLRSTVGARVDSEPRAAHELAEHCARLPLALRVVAERLLDRSDAALSDLVAELATEESRLDALAEEDELSDLRAVMTASYQDLHTDTARFFRLLGLHPGPEFSPGAAAALTDTSLPETRRLLDRLTRANLVERPREGRYRLHDLVRLYAVERVDAEEGRKAKSEAVGRVARWYTHAAARAQLVEHPNFPVVPGEEQPHELPEFASVQNALAWFETERTNLLAVARAAQERGHHDTAWRLPASVYGLFELHRHWHEWRDLHAIGLRAADDADDAFGSARNHLGMGDAQWLLGDLDAAVQHYGFALASNRQAGDSWVEGFALRQLGVVAWQRGERGDDTVKHVERAITVFKKTGEQRGEAMGLLSLADFGADLGRWDEALDHCRMAITKFEAIGDVWTVAWSRCTLGRVLTGSGHATEAVAEYRKAITVFEERDDADSRATALLGLGGAHAEQGDAAQAREALGAALDYLRDHDDPRAREISQRLDHMTADG
ncbi:ATP-binding protein [Nocardiopsis halotolerans]|uniref:ATP-binding protein n=1 Tax=Nocardiopsis halotolerans TaxID=124252 RepID=UPI00036D9C15|nr:tetratricopeptide repeat protein [Nocardiopsis halotolerans]